MHKIRVSTAIGVDNQGGESHVLDVIGMLTRRNNQPPVNKLTVEPHFLTVETTLVLSDQCARSETVKVPLTVAVLQPKCLSCC